MRAWIATVGFVCACNAFWAPGDLSYEDGTASTTANTTATGGGGAPSSTGRSGEGGGGHDGYTTSSSTSSSTVSTSTSMGGAGGSGCVDPPDPPPGVCPAICDQCPGSVNQWTCVIHCFSSNGGCGSSAVQCPPGFNCLVHCSGANSCELTTAICPVDYSCALSCDQDNACLNAYLQCDNKGPCVLDCKNGVDPCANATVNCGTGSCGAFCSNPASAKPSVQCGNACECNSC